MNRSIVVAGIAVLLLADPTGGQQGPTEAQLDSLETGLLNPAELIIREFVKITEDEDYRCLTTLVYRRADWVTGPTWEAGWDDGDDEDFSGNWSRLDNTWVELSYLPSYIRMVHDALLANQLEPLIRNLSTKLNGLYRETGEGRYPNVIPWQEIFGCDQLSEVAEIFEPQRKNEYE